MKLRVKSLILSIFLIIFTTVSFISCSTTYEYLFLGTWVCASGYQQIFYQFKKKDDGTYYAFGSTKSGSGTAKDYMFDEYSATRTVLTFKQSGGKQTKHNYYFEDGYLYIDGLEFEKF